MDLDDPFNFVSIPVDSYNPNDKLIDFDSTRLTQK